MQWEYLVSGMRFEKHLWVSNGCVSNQGFSELLHRPVLIPTTAQTIRVLLHTKFSRNTKITRIFFLEIKRQIQSNKTSNQIGESESGLESVRNIDVSQVKDDLTEWVVLSCFIEVNAVKHDVPKTANCSPVMCCSFKSAVVLGIYFCCSSSCGSSNSKVCLHSGLTVFFFIK